MVNAEIHPALTGDLPFPVTAGVVIHQFLLLRHPKQFVKLHYCFFKLFSVIILLDTIDFVIFCYDTLKKIK